MNEAIDLKTIIIEPHAIQRAKERFNLKNDQDAMNTCKTILKVGRFMGETTCERGNKGYLYASGKKGVVVSLDYSVVRTAMDFNRSYIPNIAYTNPLHQKLEKLYETEVKKYDRLEMAAQKKLDEFRIHKAVELAKLNLILFKTKSKAVRVVTQMKIDDINTEITIHENNITKIQSEKRMITKARACLT